MWHMNNDARTARMMMASACGRRGRSTLLLLLLLCCCAQAVVADSAGPVAVPTGAVVKPCSVWAELPGTNAVFARVGDGCEAAGSAPCPAGNQGGAKPTDYFYLGTPTSLLECEQLAMAPLPPPLRCQTVTFHTNLPGSFDKHCYCGTTAEWIAPAHQQDGVDSASCQSYGDDSILSSPLLLLLIGGGRSMWLVA